MRCANVAYRIFLLYLRAKFGLFMKIRLTELKAHALVWAAVVAVPLLLQFESSELSWRFMSQFWVLILSIALTFYSNYLFGIKYLLHRNRIVWFLLFNVVIFLFNDALDRGVHELMTMDDDMRPKHKPSSTMRTMFVYNKLIITALGVGAALAADYYKKLLVAESQKKQLENEKLTSEISLLKYQIQPHFFFNTLNNIYALIGKSPTEAQNAVHSLSKMMRYILYENTAETISLEKEVDFLENYNKLMLMRLSEKVSVNFVVPDRLEGINLPPLLLIPLLENAFKHGVSYQQESFIHSEIKINGNKLSFRVENTLHPQEKDEDRSHSGIGLQNLQKRLNILYGEAADFRAGPQDDKFVAQIVIPINKQESK